MIEQIPDTDSFTAEPVSMGYCLPAFPGLATWHFWGPEASTSSSAMWRYWTRVEVFRFFSEVEWAGPTDNRAFALAKAEDKNPQAFLLFLFPSQPKRLLNSWERSQDSVELEGPKELLSSYWFSTYCIRCFRNIIHVNLTTTSWGSS